MARPQPTVFDELGWSYFYNSSANNNDDRLGLFNKKTSDVRSPSHVVLVDDFAFNCYFLDARPAFEFMYWHDKNRLGFGNVEFVDGHIAYLQAQRDKPTFQRGPNWSFVYND